MPGRPVAAAGRHEEHREADTDCCDAHRGATDDRVGTDVLGDEQGDQRGLRTEHNRGITHCVGHRANTRSPATTSPTIATSTGQLIGS